MSACDALTYTVPSVIDMRVANSFCGYVLFMDDVGEFCTSWPAEFLHSLCLLGYKLLFFTFDTEHKSLRDEARRIWATTQNVTRVCNPRSHSRDLDRLPALCVLGRGYGACVAQELMRVCSARSHPSSMHHLRLDSVVLVCPNVPLDDATGAMSRLSRDLIALANVVHAYGHRESRVLAEAVDSALSMTRHQASLALDGQHTLPNRSFLSRVANDGTLDGKTLSARTYVDTTSAHVVVTDPDVFHEGYFLEHVAALTQYANMIAWLLEENRAHTHFTPQCAVCVVSSHSDDESVVPSLLKRMNLCDRDVAQHTVPSDESVRDACRHVYDFLRARAERR